MKKFALLIAGLLAFTYSQARVKDYYAVPVKEYPHDVASYTQGLFFKDGTLYESTGQWGESTFRIVDLATGKALRRLDFDKRFFIEGSTILGENLYILTWTSNQVFVYDAGSLEYKKTYRYPREGWGLTTDGESLIASDGSSTIYFMDTSLTVRKTLGVTYNGKPLKYLNELEWIDGKIWANIYTTDMIAVINPSNGVVESLVDCTSLMPAARRRGRKMDVLNGIAYNPLTSEIFLTGKYWPVLFKVEIKEKSNK